MFDITKEDYETMILCLEQIKMQIDNLNELEIDGIKYKIEKYIGGDLKMSAIIYGINQANSNCPCIWCVWDKKKLANSDIQKVEEEIYREWSIIDKEKGTRTLESSMNFQGQNGFIKKPILNIPFHKVIIDMLHLFLRISDVLYDLFIANLRQLDGKQKNEIDFSTQPHLNQFFLDLKETYKIQNPYFINGKSIKIRDLRGPEKKRLFENIDLTKYADNEKIKEIDKLWKDFWEIFNQVKRNVINKDIIKEKTSNWLINFSKLYDSTHITPYIHCFSKRSDRRNQRNFTYLSRYIIISLIIFLKCKGIYACLIMYT